MVEGRVEVAEGGLIHSHDGGARGEEQFRPQVGRVGAAGDVLRHPPRLGLGGGVERGEAAGPVEAASLGFAADQRPGELALVGCERAGNGLEAALVGQAGGEGVAVPSRGAAVTERGIATEGDVGGPGEVVQRPVPVAPGVGTLGQVRSGRRDEWPAMRWRRSGWRRPTRVPAAAVMMLINFTANSSWGLSCGHTRTW